jgi:hypothetical protein
LNYLFRLAFKWMERMLAQANHWLEIVNLATDVVLLCRILLLRLHRVYAFITLACVLAVFFDAVDFWLRPGTPESVPLVIYTRFLYAAVYPLVAWDVFEELTPRIGKIRRLAIRRLISGLIFATMIGLIASTWVGTNEPTEPAFETTFGMVLWASSSAASLAFLWTLHRLLRLEKIERPNNTSVWLIFWELSLLADIVGCFSGYTVQVFGGKPAAEDALEFIFLIIGIAITAWCIVKLRALPPDVSSAPADAKA